MQEKLTIARPYAAAAFSYADQHGELDAWSATLRTLATAVSDPVLAAFIGHPKVSDEQLLDVLGELFGARVSDATRNFLRALVEAERLELAPEVAELFERHRAQAAGQVTVEITSAFPLNDAERQKIDRAMRARLGRDCKLDARVDSSLIGGAVIKVGDSVIDLSLRGRLASLTQQLI
jgi:F-type H+-transporting ATPase subunit delta